MFVSIFLEIFEQLKMPKKDKNKKKLLLKPVLIEKELKVKYFQPSVDKQLLIKDHSNQFLQWNSWQRKILLCQCTFQSSIQFLISLSTVMEPVFHRDYQIHTVGKFDSTLLRSISQQTPKPNKEDQEKSAIIVPNKRNERWILPINQQSDELYTIADTIVRHKSPFKGIVLDDMPSKEPIDHKHEAHKNKDSITTIDFFWKYQSDKLKTLGNFVKVQKTNKSPIKKENVSEYKQKSWFLPAINKGNSLLKASRIDLLKSFKDSTNEILASYRKWSHAEKGDLVLSLLGNCTPEEMTFFGNCIQQRLREIGDVNRLPDNVLLKIFGYLNQGDLFNSSLTCKRWHRLAFHNKLWKDKCYKLAVQFNQQAVLQYLEKSPSVMLWKDIYKELNETVQQLIDNMMIYPPTSANGTNNFDNEETDNGSPDIPTEDNNTEERSRLDVDTDEEEYAVDDDENSLDSMNSSFEKMEIVHLSPNKSFATFIASESSKDSIEDTQLDNLVADNNDNSERNEQQDGTTTADVNDIAFDVRSKLIQPMNLMVI